MNLKNLFKALAALFLVVFLFASCDQIVTGPDETQRQEVYLYGNCKEDGMHGYVMGVADNRNHTYSAASLLSMPELAEKGQYLLGVRAYIGDEVTNASVWAGEDYENPTYRKEFTYKKGGWQYVMFDEPIKLNANNPDIYIGYTVTGRGGSVLAAEGVRKAQKSEWIAIDGDWSLLSKAAGNALWSMQAIITGGDYTAENQHDVVVESVLAPKSVGAGETMNVTCEVRSAGIKKTGAIEVTCTFGSASVSATVSDSLMNGQSAVVVFPAITAPTAGGVNNLVISAEETGVTDAVINDNEVRKSLRVYSETVERNCLLIEQFTGQTCPNCPAGSKQMATAIDQMADPRVVWVAHHYGYQEDLFTLSESATIGMSLGVNAAPMCNINRAPRDYGLGKEALIWHPGYATKEILEIALAEPGLATLNIARTYNADTRELTVEVKGRSIEKEAYITAIVTQSGIEAQQSGATGKYLHNNAPRKFLTTAKGNKLELDAEGNYVATFTYTIPEKVGSFACLPENMQVVAFIHGDISNEVERLVYNADAVTVVPATEAEVMRAMTLYNEVEVDMFNLQLMPWSEQICR